MSSLFGPIQSADDPNVLIAGTNIQMSEDDANKETTISVASQPTFTLPVFTGPSSTSAEVRFALTEAGLHTGRLLHLLVPLLDTSSINVTLPSQPGTLALTSELASFLTQSSELNVPVVTGNSGDNPQTRISIREASTSSNFFVNLKSPPLAQTVDITLPNATGKLLSTTQNISFPSQDGIVALASQINLTLNASAQLLTSYIVLIGKASSASQTGFYKLEVEGNQLINGDLVLGAGKRTDHKPQTNSIGMCEVFSPSQRTSQLWFRYYQGWHICFYGNIQTECVCIGVRPISSMLYPVRSMHYPIRSMFYPPPSTFYRAPSTLQNICRTYNPLRWPNDPRIIYPPKPNASAPGDIKSVLLIIQICLYSPMCCHGINSFFMLIDSQLIDNCI